MSVESMTHMSYILFTVAGVLSAVAAAAFFALDIARCWRLVSRVHLMHGKGQTKKNKEITTDRQVTGMGRNLSSGFTVGSDSFLEDEGTVLLNAENKTALLAHEGEWETEMLKTDWHVPLRSC